MKTGIGIDNKMRRGNFIKKRKLDMQLKMEINLNPLERLVGFWQHFFFLIVGGIKKRNMSFKEKCEDIPKSPTIQYYLAKKNRNKTTTFFS